MVDLYIGKGPAQARILCLDEMGPVAAKTYLCYRWTGLRRPPRDADYGRRGKVWVFGALEPATGRALTHCYRFRDSNSWVDFLERVRKHWPHDALFLIQDNLSTHRTADVLLSSSRFPEVEFVFLPTYAPYLNLIEPWWKILTSLALKGRRFNSADEIVDAVADGIAYWNRQRHPFLWRKIQWARPIYRKAI